ncbi:MAG: hypothetical protein ACJA0U_001186 [Salibacteraceae bacterium]|jgi:hypothetical protein
MVLRELSIYKEEDDFLSWCHKNGSDASSHEVLNYYRDLKSMFHEIKSILGTIDPLISNYDYGLGTIIHSSITRQLDYWMVRFEYLEYRKKKNRCLISKF